MRELREGGAAMTGSPVETRTRSYARSGARPSGARPASSMTFWRGLGLVGSVGWMVVLPALLGAFLGRWIDRRSGTGIFWTLSLLFVGLAPRLHERLAARASRSWTDELDRWLRRGGRSGPGLFRRSLVDGASAWSAGPRRAVWVPVSGAARLILLGLGLAILSRQGAGSILAALGGLWLSRWYLLRRFGGVRHGR